MTPPTITNLPKSQVQLAFVVTPDDAKPYLDQAATELQTGKPIAGFRPGKAPYDEVKKAFGEMRVWENALERIVRSQYVHAVLEHVIDTVGSPAISVEQLVPGQDIRFTVTAPVMPSVLSMAEYDQPIVTKTVRAITDAEVDATVEDLRKMRRQETVTDTPAASESMVVIDLEMKKDGVTLEGGTSSSYRVYMNEPHYIPGFAEQLIGLKKGDAKTFEVTFPKDHFQKHIAGQVIACTVNVKDVYGLTLPELNDAFAKDLGQESLLALRELLKTNLVGEAEQKADEAAEIELLEKLVRGSKFSEIPDLLVNEEVRRMVHELEHAAEHQGMNFKDYLSQLKKSTDQLKLEMIPRAMERVQTAVLIKEAAKRENVAVPDAEIDAEIDRILSGVKDKETKERVSSPEYREYVSAQMRNRKTLDVLKQKGIKQA
jgi:trigger factor